MPQLEYYLVCEGYSADQFTNRVSLFNVLEQINIAGFPGVFPQSVCAIASWNMAEEELGRDFQALLRIHIPGEAPRDFRRNFTARAKRHRLMLTLQGLPLPRAGVYRFEILLNDRPAATHDIDVVQGVPDVIAQPVAEGVQRTAPPAAP